MITSYAFSHPTSRQGLQLETYCFYTFGLTIHIVLMIVDFQGVILALLVRAMLPPNWELHRQGINRPYKHSSPLSSKPHYPSPIHSVRKHGSECILNNIQKLPLLSSSQNNQCQRLDLPSTTIGLCTWSSLQWFTPCGFHHCFPCCKPPQSVQQ